jgi:GT2 family glycosyltransferase
LAEKIDILLVDCWSGPSSDLGAIAARATSPFVLVAARDSRFDEMAVDRARAEAVADRDAGRRVAAWEFRCKPLEAAKPYDPLTLETGRLDGPAVLFDSAALRACAVGQEAPVSLAELSARLRAHGYGLRYLPHAVVWSDAGGWTNAPSAPAAPWRRYLSRFLGRRIDGRGCHNPYEAELGAVGAFRHGPAMEAPLPLVSLIMRTHAGRLSFLKDALRAVCQQTYPAIELVVVEDGTSAAAPLIAGLDQRVTYRSLPRSGRVRAGNAGLALARGRYLGFLDDDDLLWPDHVEVLVAALSRSAPDCRAAYGYAIESGVVVESTEPLRLHEIRHRLVGTDFSIAGLRRYNRFPIQAVLFDRSLYEQLGGFNETLDYLEDWDMWLRYASATPFTCVPKVTSLYRVPGRRREARRRAREHAAAAAAVRAQHGLPAGS